MAFQTNIFRDGEWVTETVNLQAVLDSQKGGQKGTARPDVPRPPKPPRCGLLTKTLIESGLANSILPVMMRSPEHNDIAFIGDHFIQICELGKDGRLKDIVRKNDFGCRIRNACVVGSAIIPELDDSPSSQHAIKTEDNHTSGPFGLPNHPGSRHQLPPQFLFVALETGDNVFLFLQPSPDGNGKPKFIGISCGGRQYMKKLMGFNLAVDPSSRYMAMASPTDQFVVSELASHTELNESYLRGEPLRMFKSVRFRSIPGVIHKMTFLHPRPGDDRHIILLLVLVKQRKGRVVSTTVIYEWELGDDLGKVFAEEKQGHRMPVEFQMPLMLIPLTVQSAFLAISADRIALCTECLHGPPMFENIELAVKPPTPNHRGRQYPLWAAWARPFRLWSYNKSRDCVYLAREDGAVLLLEADQDNALTTHALDPFPCNISDAFACLFDHSTDVLVLSSHSGHGGYWKLPPRQPAELLGILPNWSPVVDFTTTDDFTEWHPSDGAGKAMIPWQEAKHKRPDRIFATCEGGNSGYITEYRYGLRANIGLDLDYGPGMKQAWLLPYADPPCVMGYLLLISMPESTAALVLSKEFSSAAVPGDGAIPYDLSSSTLTIVSHNQRTIQVTQEAVVLANERGSILLRHQSFPELLDRHVVDACVLDDWVALSTSAGTQFRIHLFKFDLAHPTLTHVQTIDAAGDVTCLALGPDHTILAGIWTGSQAYLAWGSLQQQPLDGLHMIDLSEYVSDNDSSLGFDQGRLVEGIESIVAVGDTVFLGTRSGKLVTVKHTVDPVSIQSEKFGTTAATVSCSYRPGATDPTIFVCCDNSLVSVRFRQYTCRYSGGGGGDLKTNFRVWPIDASKPQTAVPPIHYATVVELPPEFGITPVLMISGSRLLLAEVHEDPGPVHRSMPVKSGMPNRVIYCHFLQCLIVAVDHKSGPTLTFLNPDTGENIGRPADQKKADQPCIAGLGKKGDRITALTEWNYRRDKHVWNFIIVTTMNGHLIVVTTEKETPQDGGPTTFRYWTRFRKELKEPVYAVIGYDEGLIYSTGRSVQWEVLDHQDKKLRPLKSFKLSSSATSLRISNGKLIALTYHDSLVVLDNIDSPAAADTRLCYADPWRRRAFDCIEVAGPLADADTDMDTPTDAAAAAAAAAAGGIHLVSDRERGVAALWVSPQTRDKDGDRESEVLLEAELLSSIRRFRRGRTRPVWDQFPGRPRFGRLPATVDDAEILGVALDGSLHQFTLLSVEAWRLLRFVQNMAVARPMMCPFAAGVARLREAEEGEGDGEDLVAGVAAAAGAVAGREAGMEPRPGSGLEMHVDGDILRRCLERRVLELLVVKDKHVARFTELLRALDGGRYTEGFAEMGDHAKYFRLAYEVLEYYLSSGL